MVELHLPVLHAGLVGRCWRCRIYEMIALLDVLEVLPNDYRSYGHAKSVIAGSRRRTVARLSSD